MSKNDASRKNIGRRARLVPCRLREHYGATNLPDGSPARRILNSILLFQQHHRQDRDRDRQYHIQPQRAGECRRERFVKCLTDLGKNGVASIFFGVLRRQLPISIS